MIIKCESVCHCKKWNGTNNRPRGYEIFFICSTQLSIKFFLLINVKMPKWHFNIHEREK